MTLVLACWASLAALVAQDESFSSSLSPRRPLDLPQCMSLDEAFSSGASDNPELLSEPGGGQWSVRLSAIGRQLGGRVQVREHQFQGTFLDLGADLGFGYVEGGRLSLGYATAGLRASLDVEYLDGSARKDARRDFFFNGPLYPAGEPVRTLTHFLTVRALWAWEAIVDRASASWTGPVFGLEYPYYNMNVTSPSNPHNSEDWTHYYPYPVVGWAGRLALTDGLSLGGRATVGYLPNLPSLFIEGGRLYISVRPSVWVELPLTWEVSRSVRLSAAFEYQLWHGADHSAEDGNVLRISSPGVSLSVEFAW